MDLLSLSRLPKRSLSAMPSEPALPPIFEDRSDCEADKRTWPHSLYRWGTTVGSAALGPSSPPAAADGFMAQVALPPMPSLRPFLWDDPGYPHSIGHHSRRREDGVGSSAGAGGGGGSACACLRRAAAPARHAMPDASPAATASTTLDGTDSGGGGSGTGSSSGQPPSNLSRSTSSHGTRAIASVLNHAQRLADVLRAENEALRLRLVAHLHTPLGGREETIQHLSHMGHLGGGGGLLAAAAAKGAPSVGGLPLTPTGAAAAAAVGAELRSTVPEQHHHQRMPLVPGSPSTDTTVADAAAAVVVADEASEPCGEGLIRPGNSGSSITSSAISSSSDCCTPTTPGTTAWGHSCAADNGFLASCSCGKCSRNGCSSPSTEDGSSNSEDTAPQRQQEQRCKLMGFERPTKLQRPPWPPAAAGPG
ncbi:hypothetical protein CHLRE_12g507557v5 [Chlamydomonas reinhardtii]|uniref:Uncharacterized protein n=1 Tax=Chlamydomonas reinhardtii TaxID=3055 RepID=A0A2K3D2T2_CHLRE|nr:uncharacterized protein CHLRE_12g507557v5 [Chlamydomonas reinhardtii]XP_042918183.1 uncharacterized protein CHLRE_12g507557v5 [Chlamydomonas reinhardtii]PNW74847.1 hypothetical protein CHLRE_12g507557v5 [Chlamydomonas reinhardtii]PNW74848.1 hypothetical protein CHLRE_12g507557v5 [Chlamydomonas reinhardtii]